jgi:hypothetical protein
MMREVQERLNRLKLSISLLEDYLKKYGHLIQPRPLRFIKNQVKYFKRELQIRKDFPK